MRAAVVGVLLGVAVASLQLPTTRLSPANGVLNEPFRARSLNHLIEQQRLVKELSDGRILIEDDGRKFLGDLQSGLVVPLSDVGSGTLVSLTGDSSIVAYPGEWKFLVGTRIVGVLPLTNPIVSYAKENMAGLRGADSKGFIYLMIGQIKRGDSFPVMRIDRATGERDVMTKLWPGRQLHGAVCVNYERDVIAADGWIAVLRANPYRVDWLSPNRQWTLGAPIPTPAVRVTAAEKQVYLAWEGKDRKQLPQVPANELEWPETMCPWHSGYEPLATLDGKVVVYRVPTTGGPATRYDVVNHRGQLERQFVMAANEAIIGFGRASVYVVTTDGGTQKISRHPWP